MERKRTFAAALSAGLLSLSATAVAAQDEAAEPDLTATTYVTGTFSDPARTVQGTDIPADGGLLEHRDYQWARITVDMDDPRLDGIMTVNANGNERFLSGTVGQGPVTDIQAFSARLTNDDGGWTGQGSAFIHVDGPSPSTHVDTIVLTGYGAYDGLTAYLVTDQTLRPVAVEGTVFAGEMTPYPDVPAEETGS